MVREGGVRPAKRGEMCVEEPFSGNKDFDRVTLPFFG